MISAASNVEWFLVGYCLGSLLATCLISIGIAALVLSLRRTAKR